jgi:hypothetical protein
MPGLGIGQLLVPSSELHLCFMPQASVVMFVSFCITRQVSKLVWAEDQRSLSKSAQGYFLFHYIMKMVMLKMFVPLK